MRSSRIAKWALGGLMILSGPALAAETPQKETPPEPDQVVRRMCDYLKSQQRFSYRAEVTDDRVYAGGKKSSTPSRKPMGITITVGAGNITTPGRRQEQRRILR